MTRKADAPIASRVVEAEESIDLDAFLRQYAQAIVDARGLHEPSAGETIEYRPPASGSGHIAD